MNQLPNLSDNELHGTLMNALAVAADKYRANAQQMREAAPLYQHQQDIGRTPFITGSGALSLADQFDQQASDCFALIDKFQEHFENDD